VEHGIGGLLGSVIVFALLVAVAVGMWLASQRKPVDHSNVNEAWDEGEPARPQVGTVMPPELAAATSAALEAVDVALQMRAKEGVRA
jgi:PiT family inorganic phosphate transporter